MRKETGQTGAGDKIFDITLQIMIAGPVIATVFEGVESVVLLRKMVGANQKKQPKKSHTGSVILNYSTTRRSTKS
ncbi:hypothetical protein H7142_00875 [Candidatus Saccharibacteria bacterium]|nr:hypothetical protein [Candidatus Saccharibacteria bacterium]